MPRHLAAPWDPRDPWRLRADRNMGRNEEDKMKRTIWMKRAVVCLISGLILAAAAGGTAFGEEETSTYDRIVNSRSGVTSRVVSQRSRTDDEDEEDDETGRTYREEDRKTGPGAAAEVEIIDDSGSAGPSVEDVSLSEEYHEDFGVYEEALGDRYFLYSNVENGGSRISR